MTLQDPQGTGEAKSSLQSDMESNPGHDVPVPDLSGTSVPVSEDSKKVSREHIELVQNLIERCLLLHMNRNEVVAILRSQAKIEPGFTSLVWQKLEEENAEFFRAYYTRLKLKKQILLFNNLLEHQHHLMAYPARPNVPLATLPLQNGIPSLPVNNIPMGYPVMQHPAMPATGQPHLDSSGLSGCHMVNGVPARGNFHPVRVNLGNDMTDREATNIVSAALPYGATSEMAIHPASEASNGHVPFTQSEIPGIGIDPSVLDSAFISDVGTTGGLQLGIDSRAGSSKDTLRSGGQLPWNLSLTDLTADLTNLEDLGALGNYTGSPFLHGSDILLNADDDDIVDDYIIDDISGPSSQSDEEKS